MEQMNNNTAAQEEQNEKTPTRESAETGEQQQEKQQPISPMEQERELVEENEDTTFGEPRQIPTEKILKSTLSIISKDAEMGAGRFGQIGGNLGS